MPNNDHYSEEAGENILESDVSINNELIVEEVEEVIHCVAHEIAGEEVFEEDNLIDFVKEANVLMILNDSVIDNKYTLIDDTIEMNAELVETE